MELADILEKELCEPHLRSRKKRAAIEEIAAILRRHDALAHMSQADVFDPLMAREELGSTGFGEGLAIPHCRLPGLDRFVLGVAVSPRGVAFEALDDRRVHLFCFLAGPEDLPKEHVRILAAISKVLRAEAARRELLKAPTATALYESFLRRAMYEAGGGGPGNVKLLMLVLQDQEYVTDVMELFVEMGIQGASVLESRGMGEILSGVPLFASFINFLGGREEHHRTIFALVPEGQVGRLVDAIEEITGDMDKHTGAMALALDVSLAKGSLQTI